MENPRERQAARGGLRPELYYYTEQQLQDAERAFSLASSSSACAAHTGEVMGVRKTLSRFLSSFSSSMASLRFMIALSNESKRSWMPVSSDRSEHRRRSSNLSQRGYVGLRTSVIFSRNLKQFHAFLEPPFAAVHVITILFVFILVAVTTVAAGISHVVPSAASVSRVSAKTRLRR